MPKGKGYGDSMHRGDVPAKKPLSHHTDPSHRGSHATAHKSTTTPPFKNVGDSRQRSHSYGGQGHSGGQGRKRATSEGTGKTGSHPGGNRGLRSGSNPGY